MIGCRHGCPLGYHEDSCPSARPEPSAYERGYADGYAAGFREALAETELRDRALRRAHEERQQRAQPRQTIRVERLDTTPEIA